MQTSNATDIAAAFFAENAGYSYDPKTETAKEGRERVGRILAAAEGKAKEFGFEVLWVEDDEPAEFQEEDGSWNSADASVAVLRDSNGTILASLGGIIESGDYAERRNYRRVVAAELASEAVAKKIAADAEAIVAAGIRSNRRNWKKDIILPYIGGTETHDLPNGWTVEIEIEIEQDYYNAEPSWERGDGYGYGIVSEWTSRDKRPGERVLVSDRDSKRFYDIEATTKKAKREGWDIVDEKATPGMTRKARIAAAVEADFEFHRGYANDEWTYAGYIVTLRDEAGNELNEDSCLGFETVGTYLRETVRSAIAGMIVQARKEARKARALAEAERQADIFKAIVEADKARHEARVLREVWKVALQQANASISETTLESADRIISRLEAEANDATFAEARVEHAALLTKRLA
jgi:hypothetical protein